MKDLSVCKLRISLLLFFALAAVSWPKAALAQIWVASTGTVDESSLSKIQFNSAIATLRSSVTTGSATIRYNVLPIGSLIVPLQGQIQDQCRVMRVRYLDNGTGAQVIVRLKRYNLVTGGVATIWTFDSNNFASSTAFQEQSTECPAGSFNFAFATTDAPGFAYYLEATLTRSATGGTPALALIRIITLDSQ